MGRFGIDRVSQLSAVAHAHRHSGFCDAIIVTDRHLFQAYIIGMYQIAIFKIRPELDVCNSVKPSQLIVIQYESKIRTRNVQSTQ